MTATEIRQVTWVAGPDAGECHPLTIGRTVVGRAPSASVRCDDPAIQPFHAVIDHQPDGSVWCTPLSARPPLRLGGEPISERVRWADGQHLEIGHSVLELQHGSDESSIEPLGLLGDAVVRRPRAMPSWQPADITPPIRQPRYAEAPGGLTPALIGVAGSAVMALVFRQLLFVLFGAVGAAVALGSWLAQRGAASRRRHHDDEEFDAACAAFEQMLEADRRAFVEAHRSSTPTAATARRLAESPDAHLWSRRTDHHDAMRASVGLGAVPWRRRPVAVGQAQPLEPMVVDPLPVEVHLGNGARVALHGAGAASVARSLLVQLATSCGPGDLRMVVVTAHPREWAWTAGLPHATLLDGRSAVIDGGELDDVLLELQCAGPSGGPHVLLVVDDVAALSTLTSVVRRALHGRANLALLAVLVHEHGAPQLCSSVLSVPNSPIGRWVADTSASLLPVPVRWAGIGADGAARAVAGLRRFTDPEDPLLAAGRTPRDVVLSELLGLDLSDRRGVDQICERWRCGADDGAPRTPLGRAGDGIVDVDLVRDGPHALVAGTTGAGKSELLRALVVGLAVEVPPTLLQFVLVDYKGGATFDSCIRLPHVSGVVTDLDEHLADRVLRSLQAELRRREAMLRRHGVADLVDLWRADHDETLPRLVVVIDEFATLVVEQPRFLHSLVAVAQRGRSLGVHLVLATQRPAGSVTDDIRANTALRIALRLPDDADSVDVVGDVSAARLPRKIAGRAVMRLGADERVVFQTARVDAGLVDAVCAAARQASMAHARPPWQPPLPDALSAFDVEPGAVGLVDDPDHQRRSALRWSPVDGCVVVVGAEGSGVTSALAGLVGSAVDARTVGSVYIVGSPVGAFAALASHPSCAFVDVRDRERLHRLLHHVLVGAQTEFGAATLLVIDDLHAVRRTLDTPSTTSDYDRLDALLCGHPDSDLVVLVGTHQAASLPAALVARCERRVVLHLHDPHDALAVGVASRHVPAAVAGRAFVLPEALEAQLVRSSHRVVADSTRARLRVDVVPAVVDPTWLPPGRRDDAVTLLPIGADVASASPFVFALPDDEHALIAGPARSGRSAALTRLASSWRSAHSNGRVVAVLPRRSTFDLTLADRVLDASVDSAGFLDACKVSICGRTLVVIDDAELFDDLDGVVREWLTRPSGVEVVAAGRADALRQGYGHWTAVLRRGRLGLLAASCGELDADLFGTVLPRRLPVAPRPGLMWALQQGDVRLVQVAWRDRSVDQAEPIAAAHRSSAVTPSSTISSSVRP
jgi:S-DNA-T family DNA segregation ATPase FtsK/SpoIIIE